MKRLFFVVIALTLIVIGFASFRRKSGRRDDWVEIRGERFSVEIADEEKEQIQGLSGRESLCSKCGMLFVYATVGPRIFWMKEMRFPLDFVWIRDGRVVELTSNVSSPGVNEPPTVVSPREPADAVLEVPAATIALKGWQIGDLIERK